MYYIHTDMYLGGGIERPQVRSADAGSSAPGGPLLIGPIHLSYGHCLFFSNVPAFLPH